MPPHIHWTLWPSLKIVPPRHMHIKSSLIPLAVESAMRAATHIMNDDLESAEASLANGTSSFHKVRYPLAILPNHKADRTRRRRRFADDVILGN